MKRPLKSAMAIAALLAVSIAVAAEWKAERDAKRLGATVGTGAASEAGINATPVEKLAEVMKAYPSL